jgi:hypothetical protein
LKYSTTIIKKKTITGEKSIGFVIEFEYLARRRRRRSWTD